MPEKELFTNQDDEDAPFTFTKLEDGNPRIELEEELGATILRIAKEQFHKRRPRAAQPSIEKAASEAGSEPSSRATSARPETEDEEEERMDTDELTPERQTRSKRNDIKTYEPVVSADDELSYELLKQPTQHILTQLDNTLSILRNSRIAGLTYLSESSTEEESETEKKSRGRPRANNTGSEAETDVTPKASKRGRPRKVRLPQEGETQDEMQLRIARESHRRLPVTSDDKDAAFEEWLRKGDEAIERQRSLSRARSDPSGAESVEDEEEDESGVKAAVDKKKKIRRWGLRDWSDVLGAAALAGFSSDAISRATQRCADLFGEGMIMSKLNEVPLSQGTGIVATEYRPKPIHLTESESDADDEEDEDDETMLSQRRVASRQASLARSSRELSSDFETRGRRASRSQTGTPAPGQRSRSGSGSLSCSSPGLAFCPISSCDRAAKGFTRKANLRRHMELVHQGQTEDLDSDDEVAGAVHVDGFLKTIVPSRGWRGEDTMVRKRRRVGPDIGGNSRSRATAED